MFSKLEAPPTPSPPRTNTARGVDRRTELERPRFVALRPHPGYLSGDHLARGGQVGEGKALLVMLVTRF